MIIKRFSARKVHDFYDYSFSFHPDINFLVGDNGTGKTTALRLMQAALSIDITTLMGIKFSSLSVEVEKDGEEFVFSVSTSSDKMTFNLNGEENPYTITPAFNSDGNRIIETINAHGRIRHRLEDNRLDVITFAGPVMQRFLRGTRPMFLGLERRLGRYQEDSFPEESYADEGLTRPRNQQKEILDGLENCQRLVQGAYKQYRKASDGRLDRLLNIIVESTFEYIELEPGFLENPSLKPYLEMSDLRQRRQELEKFARDLGGSEKTTVLIEKFFEKMVGVVDKDNGLADSWSLEWLLNMAQIRRIQKVLAEMDRQKKAAEKFYAPIREFCDTINEFFKHSRKELTVDSLGKIKVTQNSIPVDLEFLSSGEKQLLILIAHARFGSSKRSAFVVDEPEVSLHMRWQEMLVDALLKGGKNNQFIFATHSPEIVGYHTNNCIRLS
jgi:predicted ATPase